MAYCHDKFVTTALFFVINLSPIMPPKYRDKDFNRTYIVANNRDRFCHGTAW